MATIFRAPLITKPGIIPPGRSVLDSEGSVWQNGLGTLLKGQDQFFGLAGHPTFDFPNPRGPQFPIALRSADDNLLLRTLGALPPPPFRQMDWPVVRPLRYPIGLRQNTSFVESADAPFSMTDWPVPKGRIPAISLKTWTQATRFQTDTFFAAPGMGPTYDWPNPRGPQFPISLRHEFNNLVLDTLGIVFPVPKNNYDWPVPGGPVPATSLRTWVEPTKLNLLGMDQFFAAAGMAPARDFPNPYGRSYPPSLRSTESRNATILFTPLPFNVSHWPNPVLLKRLPQAIQSGLYFAISTPVVASTTTITCLAGLRPLISGSSGMIDLIQGRAGLRP